eukprot:c679_g2_i1.p1 GENE.c679_g2_i1~~c679_g2_i1.p1  ORF type:complete len:126 (+),score=34.88 c679_g2_i1:184-561(+)
MRGSDLTKIAAVAVLGLLIGYFSMTSQLMKNFREQRDFVSHELSFAKATMEVQMATIQSLQAQLSSVQEANQHHANLCQTRLDKEKTSVAQCQSALEAANQAREMLHQSLPRLFTAATVNQGQTQ